VASRDENAARLRAALAERGLSQETMNGYCTGRRPLGRQNADRIERELGLPEGYFLRPAETRQQQLDELATLRREVDGLREWIVALQREVDELSGGEPRRAASPPERRAAERA